MPSLLPRIPILSAFLVPILLAVLGLALVTLRPLLVMPILIP